MRRVVAMLMVLGLASCTKANAVKGIGLGAGTMLAGFIVFETDDYRGASFQLSDQQAAGALIAGSGLVLATVSLLALIGLAIRDAVPPPDPSFRPTPDPDPTKEHCGIDGNCVPIDKPKPQ